ncbi:Uncharacterised protein [Vibrio cholerae]|nr:Uncharacterised protein [Vibrio cholerae]
MRGRPTHQRVVVPDYKVRVSVGASCGNPPPLAKLMLLSTILA